MKEGKIFISERSDTAWEKWKLYRKQQHSFTYKSDITERSGKKKLYRLSGGNEGLSLLIIEQSYEHGWETFYPLKTPPEIKSKPIPIQQKEPDNYEIASPEAAAKFKAQILATIKRTGGIGKPAPVDVLKQRFYTFKRHENMIMPDKKQQLLTELKQFPDKYVDEIKYMTK